MKNRAENIFHPSTLLIFLLLVALSLTAAPLAAQSARPDCKSDATVMNWNEDAATGTTFTMTKDCTTTDGTNLRPLATINGKTFTIEGGNNTIYATNKSLYNTGGTVFEFEGSANISLTVRNLTIEGGGTARTGSKPNPAIIVNNGTLVLENVTIQNTRGGAIRVDGTGTVTLKNVKLIGNQVSGTNSGVEGAAITMNSGRLNLQNLFTLKTNTGGVGAMHIKSAATLDIDTLYCLDVSGNQNASSTAVDIHPALTGELKTKWDGKPTVTDDSCDGTVAPTATATATPVTPAATTAPSGGTGNGGDSAATSVAEMTIGDKMRMGDSNYGRRIKGTLGSDRSAYYLTYIGGVLTLQIYRVDDKSVGHWVMNVSQTAVNALSGAGCVAASPDGRYAVRVWADGNVTISDGPDMESKVFHSTLMSGLSFAVISTQTTHSSTPPGVGCPGYIG